MIHLTCGKCLARLEIDDAFAGGVCRCKHCGAIQAVPKPSPKKTKTPSPLPHSPLPSSPTPSSLEDLAQLVHTATAPPPPPPKTSANRLPLLLGLTLAVLALAGVLWGVYASRIPGSGGVSGVSAGGKSPENSSQNSDQTPNFLGTPLQGPLVIYLLDRGSGTLDTFDLLRQAAFQSLATLGPNCRFQLIFWETDTLAVFPLEPQSATPKNIDALRPAVMDIYAAGQSRIAPALQKALAANPSQIVLATGKSGLDNDFVQTVLDLRKASPVPIHTFALGPSASPEALQTLAEKTAGTFKILSIQELRALVD